MAAWSSTDSLASKASRIRCCTCRFSPTTPDIQPNVRRVRALASCTRYVGNYIVKTSRPKIISFIDFQCVQENFKLIYTIWENKLIKKENSKMIKHVNWKSQLLTGSLECMTVVIRLKNSSTLMSLSKCRPHDSTTSTTHTRTKLLLLKG